MSTFGINVFDFGAKGDGVTDDTDAIQAAIDFTANRGGGKILFPFTRYGYRIAAPGKETSDGKAVRAQLVIPTGEHNITFEGEMPCRLLNSYQVRPLNCDTVYEPTKFGTMSNNNTFIFSDWEAPEEHDPEARPWSVLAAPEGSSCAGKFSVSNISVINLEFRVYLNTEKMYPTQSAVNLQNVSRVQIYNSQFCLDEQVGDTVLRKELQPNPCHTVGLMTSGDQNDDNVLHNVASQGFRYGFVLGEHVTADYLYVHNCEEGIVFHDASHLSVIGHIVAQHNRVIISTTRNNLFGHKPGPCNIKVGAVDFECGTGLLPAVSQLRYGVYDPERRLRGSLTWHKPWGKKEFPTVSGDRFKIIPFYEAF